MIQDSHLVLIHEDASVTLISLSDNTSSEWNHPSLSEESISMIYARVVLNRIFLCFKSEEDKIFTKILSALDDDEEGMEFEVLGTPIRFPCDSGSLLNMVVGDELKNIIAKLSGGMNLALIMLRN